MKVELMLNIIVERLPFDDKLVFVCSFVKRFTTYDTTPTRHQQIIVYHSYVYFQSSERDNHLPQASCQPLKVEYGL